MIEGVDVGIITVVTAILGKMGMDERSRRKNGGPDGNGKLEQRLAAVETAVAGLTQTIDKGVTALRLELLEARVSRGELHERCTKNEVAVAKCETRLEALP